MDPKYLDAAEKIFDILYTNATGKTTDKLSDKEIEERREMIPAMAEVIKVIKEI